jgi:ATP-binding cassette, subfamily B, bacterial MsbA
MTTTNNRELYKRLLGYVKPYRWAFFLAVLAMAIGGAVQGSFALFLNTLLEGLFAEGGERYALWGALGIVAIFFVSGISLFAAGYGMQYVGTKVIMDLRNSMFQRLIRLPEPFFSTTTTGTLMSKVTYDVMGLQEASSNALNALVRGLLTLVVAIATMFYLSWKLTLIVFATLPILAYVISVFGKRLRNVARQHQIAQAEITDVLQETVRGHKVIKVFGGEPYESSRFDAAANQLRKLSMKHAAAAAAGTPFTHLVVSAAIGLIVYLAASRHLGTGLSMASFVTYIVAAAGLVPQIKALTGVSEQIQRGLAAAESVFALVDAELEQDTGHITVARARGDVVFEHVSLRYAEQTEPALNHVSVTVAAGQTIALVGPSGGGKSSFINLLPRFFTPTVGRITLDAHALSDIKLTDLRRQMALVSQEGRGCRARGELCGFH